MKDTDKTQQSYLHGSNSFSGLSPRSHLNNMVNNSLHQSGQEMLYGGGTTGTSSPPTLGEYTPEMYAHYMYMYNYMYMQQQQQQLAWTSSVFPADPYGILASSAAASATTNSTAMMAQDSNKAVGHPQKSIAESDNIKAIRVVDQQQHRSGKKAALSPRQEQARFQPYTRPLKVSKEAKAACSLNRNVNNTSLKSQGNTTTTVMGSNSTGFMNVNEVCHKKDSRKSSTESPLDLSRKTEKLQYLDTLRQLIESSDRRTVSSSASDGVNRNISSRKRKHSGASSVSYEEHNVITCKTVIKQGGSVDNENDRSRSPNLNKDKVSSDKSGNTSLESKKDKLEFLSVLKELFEKGHSKTSQNILGEEKTEESVVSIKQEKCTVEASEDDLDDLSVDQSLVIRKKQNL